MKTTLKNVTTFISEKMLIKLPEQHEIISVLQDGNKLTFAVLCSDSDERVFSICLKKTESEIEQSNEFISFITFNGITYGLFYEDFEKEIHVVNHYELDGVTVSHNVHKGVLKTTLYVPNGFTGANLKEWLKVNREAIKQNSLNFRENFYGI